MYRLVVTELAHQDFPRIHLFGGQDSEETGIPVTIRFDGSVVIVDLQTSGRCFLDQGELLTITFMFGIAFLGLQFPPAEQRVLV